MAVTHRSLSIAEESVFGSVASGTGVPDPTSLTYYSIPCERDPIIVPGEPPVSERNEGRDGPHGLPPELDTTSVNGTRQQRRTGTVTVRCDFTTLGSSAANYDATALGLLLGAGLARTIPAAATDTVAAAVSDNRFTATSLASFKLGGLIGIELSGRAEYAHVTCLDAGGTQTDIGYSPKLSRALNASAPDVVRLLETWYVPRGTDSGTVNSSVALRVDGVGVRSYATGCKLESLNITIDGGRLMGEFTFQAAHIYDDHGNAGGPVEPVTLSGSTPHFRNCFLRLSDAASTSRTNITGIVTSGDELGAIDLSVSAFDLTLTNTLTPIGQSSSLIGMSDMEVSDVVIECNITVDSPNTNISNDFRDGFIRSLLIGSGPVGAGQGMALNIPGAYLTVDPLIRQIDGEIVQQQLTYSASRFGGDLGSTDAANTPFRLALGI